jgi:hypothetical protein
MAASIRATADKDAVDHIYRQLTSFSAAVQSRGFASVRFDEHELRTLEASIVKNFEQWNRLRRIMTIAECAFLQRCLMRSQQLKLMPRVLEEPDAITAHAYVRMALHEWPFRSEFWGTDEQLEKLDRIVCTCMFYAAQRLRTDFVQASLSGNRMNGGEHEVDKVRRGLVSTPAAGDDGKQAASEAPTEVKYLWVDHAERGLGPDADHPKRRPAWGNVSLYKQPEFSWSRFLQESCRLWLWTTVHNRFRARCVRRDIPLAWYDTSHIWATLERAAGVSPTIELTQMVSSLQQRFEMPLGAVHAFCRLSYADSNSCEPAEVMVTDCGSYYTGKSNRSISMSPRTVLQRDGNHHCKNAWALAIWSGPLDAYHSMSFVHQFLITSSQLVSRSTELWAVRYFQQLRLPLIVHCGSAFCVQCVIPEGVDRAMLHADETTVAHELYDCGDDIVLAIVVWCHAVRARFKGRLDPLRNISERIELTLSGPPDVDYVPAPPLPQREECREAE